VQADTHKATATTVTRIIWCHLVGTVFQIGHIAFPPDTLCLHPLFCLRLLLLKSLLPAGLFQLLPSIR
jgi:hypothetical protein